jgi:hypothetical protein
MHIETLDGDTKLTLTVGGSGWVVKAEDPTNGAFVTETYEDQYEAIKQYLRLIAGELACYVRVPEVIERLVKK